MEKEPFLDRHHGLTPLEKCQFLYFWTSRSYTLERRFFVLVYRKRHSPGIYYVKKKKLEKLPSLNQNHGLTPLEKCEFLDFLNFFFLYPRKAFFRSRISKKTFSCSTLPKVKKLEKWPFLNQNHGSNLLEKCQFLDVLKFLFL